MKTVKLIVITSLCICLSGCGGGGGSTTVTSLPPATQVTTVKLALSTSLSTSNNVSVLTVPLETVALLVNIPVGVTISTCSLNTSLLPSGMNPVLPNSRILSVQFYGLPIVVGPLGDITCSLDSSNSLKVSDFSNSVSVDIIGGTVPGTIDFSSLTSQIDVHTVVELK